MLTVIFRERFEQSELVYVPHLERWCPPSSCLWTTSTRISGKAAISNDYDRLEDLFVRRLLVQKPTLSMYVHELKSLVDRDPCAPIERVKNLIMDINTHNPCSDALDDLKSSRVLPLRNTDGTLSLATSQVVFGIVDLPAHGEFFRGKLPLLDFQREEVYALQPFLISLGLRHHHMSEAVFEVTTADSGPENRDYSAKIQERAFAITR